MSSSVVSGSRGSWLPCLALCALACASCADPASPTTETAEAARPAQTAGPPADPVVERAARSFFDALHASDWRGCARVLHPDALEQFRAMLLPRLVEAGRSGRESDVLGLLEGVESLDALESLDAESFFSRYMTGVLGLTPQVEEMLAASSTRFLGQLPEGPDRVHVVYRMTGSLHGIGFEEVKVLQVKRHGTGWKPLLSDEVKSFAQASG